MNEKVKSVLIRFTKGLVSGAVTAMVAVPIIMPVEWQGFREIVNNLLIAGCFGGGVGLLLALQKWASWQE